MTDRTIPEPVELDRQWDAFLRGDHAETADPLLSHLHRSTSVPQPSSHFVTDLRSALVAAATADLSGPVGLAPSGPASTPGRQNTRHSARAARSRRFDRIGTIASVAAAALLLVMIAGTLYRTLPGRQSGPGGFIQAPPPTAKPVDFADVSTLGVDNQRTNIQPGPAPAGPLAILNHTHDIGSHITLADNQLIVVNYHELTVLDAQTLTLKFHVTLADGYYGPATVAGNRLVLGYTRDPETGMDDEGNSQLVALALADGHELWRIPDAGTMDGPPAVANGIVYSVGATPTETLAGAYKLTDGSKVWQTPVGGLTYCCPWGHVAISADTIIVSLQYHTVALNLINGQKRWASTARSSEFQSSAVIIGDLVIVNSAQPTEFNQTWIGTDFGGAVTAYDLKTGDVRWRDSDLAAFDVSVTGISGSPDIVFAGADPDSRTFIIARLDGATGARIWTRALPSPGPGSPNYNDLRLTPVSVGNQIYLITNVLPDNGGAIGQSLLSVLDAQTGATESMAQFDGAVSTSPLVSGGHVFIQTTDAGLYSLGGMPNSATPVDATPAVTDLRTPITCNARPVPNPLLGNLPQTPSIPGSAPKATTTSDLATPGVGTVDTATARQLDALFTDYRNCSALDPYNGVFAFFSTDFYVRLLANGPNGVEGGVNQPWAIWMAPMVNRLTLDTSSLRMLSDGRFEGIVNGTWGDIAIWFVQENGTWKIDEYHNVSSHQPSNSDIASPAPILTPVP